MTGLTKYLKVLFSSAKKLTLTANKKTSEENIHNLRVSLKKIKAVLHLIQFYGQRVSDDELKKFRKLFKDAGNIREHQLIVQVVKNTDDSGQREAKEKLMLALNQKLKNGLQKFKHRYHHRGENIIRKTRAALIDASRKLTDSNFNSYFELMLKSISEKVSQPISSNEEYHLLRRFMKELKYNFPLADEQCKRVIENLFPEKKITRLEEVLGQWHDEVIIVNRLGKFRSKMESDLQLNSFIQQLIQAALSRAGFLLAEIRKGLAEYDIVSHSTHSSAT